MQKRFVQCSLRVQVTDFHEKYGLIGSTEWGEDFADWIDEHVVAYLNLDSSVSGSRFRSSASPSLAHLVRSTAERVAHPTKPGLTLWDATKDGGELFGDNLDEEVLQMYESSLAADSLGVSPLGSGSDYTVFLQRIGVCLVFILGFGRELHEIIGRKLKRRIWFHASRPRVSLP